MEKLEWSTETRQISDLCLYENNPRRMSEKQAKELMESIIKFNIVELPVIDGNNRVIAGNMRIKALRVIGRGEEAIEVRVPNRALTERESSEYLLRSNKNTGEWDIDLLANFDEELLLNIGWEKQEIDFSMQDNGVEEKKPAYPIVPMYDEKYNIVVIFAKTEIDVKYVEEVLKLGVCNSYKNTSKAMTKVIDVEHLRNALENKSTNREGEEGWLN
jgi:hypothetical protein